MGILLRNWVSLENFLRPTIYWSFFDKTLYSAMKFLWISWNFQARDILNTLYMANDVTWHCVFDKTIIHFVSKILEIVFRRINKILLNSIPFSFISSNQFSSQISPFFITNLTLSRKCSNSSNYCELRIKNNSNSLIKSKFIVFPINNPEFEITLIRPY